MGSWTARSIESATRLDPRSGLYCLEVWYLPDFHAPITKRRDIASRNAVELAPDQELRLFESRQCVLGGERRPSFKHVVEQWRPYRDGHPVLLHESFHSMSFDRDIRSAASRPQNFSARRLLLWSGTTQRCFWCRCLLRTQGTLTRPRWRIERRKRDNRTLRSVWRPERSRLVERTRPLGLALGTP